MPTLAQKLEAAQKENKALTEQNKALTEEATTLKAAAEESKQKIEGLEGEKKTLEEAAAKHAEEMKAKTEEAEKAAKEIESLKGKLGNSPAHMDLSPGVDPVEGGDKGDGASGDLWKQYQAIKDPAEKTRFYDEHEKELKAESKAAMQSQASE